MAAIHRPVFTLPLALRLDVRRRYYPLDTVGMVEYKKWKDDNDLHELPVVAFSPSSTPKL